MKVGKQSYLAEARELSSDSLQSWDPNPCTRQRLLHEYQEFVEILRQRCLTGSPAFTLLKNLQFAQSVPRCCLQDQNYSPNTILPIEKMSSVSICGLRFFISSRLVLYPFCVRREWLCFCPHLALMLCPWYSLCLPPPKSLYCYGAF